jgi:DNA-binding MarR family transcriptional regulator
MTATRTESRAPVPPNPVGAAIGQAVGQAESVLSRLLAGVLARTGTKRETYLALQRLLVHGDHMGREDYVRDLSDALDVDLWSAGEMARELVADGLVTLTGESIKLSEAGAGLRERIRNEIGDVMAPVWEQLDPADIETTVRTLGRVTTLARAVRSAPVPLPATGES